MSNKLYTNTCTWWINAFYSYDFSEAIVHTFLSSFQTISKTVWVKLSSSLLITFSKVCMLQEKNFLTNRQGTYLAKMSTFAFLKKHAFWKKLAKNYFYTNCILPWTFDETKPGIACEVMIGFVAESTTKMRQIIIRSWNVNGMCLVKSQKVLMQRFLHILWFTHQNLADIG